MTEEITTPIETEPEAAPDVETIVIDGWTCYLTYSHLLPPLTPEEYAELKADIEKNGMLVPVLLSQTGKDRHYHVLDGQHRLKIAAELDLRWMDFHKNYRNQLTPEEREELALNLNLHRRHLTLEQRRDLALKFRGEGQSYRQIAETLGSSPATIMRDVAAGVSNETPETVTGLDGKSYPAHLPEETRTARNAEKLLTYLAAQKPGPVRVSRMMSESGQRPDDFTKAFNLLEAESKITVQHYTLGNMVTLVAPSPVEGDTKTSEDADRIYQYVLADGGEKGTIGAARVCNMLNMEPTAFTRAVNLLEADGRITRTRPSGGVTLLTAVVPPAPVEGESATVPDHIAYDPETGEVVPMPARADIPEFGPEPPTPWKSDEPDQADIEPETDEAKITHDAERAREAAEVMNDALVADVPEVAVTITDQEARALAETLPMQQREMLVAICRQLTIPRQASTRTALINRGLIQNQAMGEGWRFDKIELTDKGREVAAQIMLHPDLNPTIISVPENSADPVPTREPVSDQSPLTRETILAQAARCSASDLKANWGGWEFEATPLHKELESEGLIVPVRKWSSGSPWLIGYVLRPPDGAPADVDTLETVLVNAVSAIDLALKVPAPDWNTIDADRRDALMQALRQTEDAAAALLHRVEETWWPRDVTVPAEVQ